MTSIRSPEISLPAADSLFLSFRYYLAHSNNSSNADYLRVTVEGVTSTMVFEEVGAPENDDGVWSIFNANLDEFSGQPIHVFISAADEASDSLVEAAIDDVLLIAQNANQAPMADAQSVSTPEDTRVDIVLTGSDPEGDPLTFSLVTTPTHGTLSGVAPDLSYTPEANYNGADSFTFVANDGYQDSAPATVSIEVTPVNDAPQADPQSVTTYVYHPVNITLTGSDVDGDSMTFRVVVSPTHGSLSGQGPDLVYTPNAGYNGPDSFSFVANDGTVDSAPAGVEISVNPAVYVPLVFRQ